MPSTYPLLPKPDHRILFKPVENCQNGGCFLDVYLPSKPHDAPPPIAIVIHGGGWVKGTSDYLPPDQVDYLLRAGFVVISLEYRFMPHVRIDGSRQDILDGYRFIVEDLSNTISLPFDVDRTICMGWSAGGTLALQLAADVQKSSLPPIKAIISTYAITDFRDPLLGTESVELFEGAMSSEEQAQYASLKQELTRTSIGMRDNLDGVRVTWYNKMLAQGCFSSYCLGPSPPSSQSPIHLLTPTFPPTYIVLGTTDTRVPPDQSRRLFARMQELGVECVLNEVEGMGHGPAEKSRGDWPEGVDWWESGLEPALRWAIRKSA